MKQYVKHTFVVLKAIVIILISLLFGSMIDLLFNWLLEQLGLTMPENLSLMIMYAWVFLVLWFLLRFWAKIPLSSLGFQVKGYVGSFYVGSLMGVLLMSIGLGVLLLTSSVSVESYSFRYNLILAVFIDFVAVALIEEILFRGYMLRKFMRKMNKYVALGVSAFIFALIHAANPNFAILPFFNLFLAGILLGATFIFTRNIWFAIGLHLFWNFWQALLGFNVSGTSAPSILLLKYSDNNIINGGEFGFEGSILCSILSLIAIVGVIFYYEWKRRRMQKVVPSIGIIAD